MAEKINRNEIRISTNRLNIRVFGPDDVTLEYAKALNDPEVVGLTESRYRQVPHTIASAREYAKWANGATSLFLGIFTQEGSQHIGNIRLHTIDTVNDRAELGIMIWNKRFWGKGFATEALSAVVAYAFDVFGWHKIEAEYYSTNIGSQRIFDKAGFQVEGVIRDHFFVNGKFVDAIRVGIIQSD